MAQKESVSLWTLTGVHFLAWLSRVFPNMDPKIASSFLLLIPTAFVVVSIVCWYFGFYIIGVVVFAVLVLIVVAALYKTATSPRLAASREAIRLYEYAGQQVRLKQYNWGTIYAPQGSARTTMSAFILYPDAHVSSVAYAPIASKISQQGVLVVVPNTDPYRVVSTMVDCTLNKAKFIKETVDKDYKIQQWAVGGHDVGSSVAAALAEPWGLNKMVVWGRYRGSATSSVNVEVLVVSSKQEMEQNARLLPNDRETITHMVLDNCGHAVFASTDGGESVEDQVVDAAATITAVFVKEKPDSQYERMPEES